MNKTKKDMFSSFGIALIGTFINIIYKKIGGHAAGGIYTEPHTWDEMLQLIPSFLTTFFIIFCVFFLYFSVAKSDDKE